MEVALLYPSHISASISSVSLPYPCGIPTPISALSPPLSQSFQLRKREKQTIMDKVT